MVPRLLATMTRSDFFWRCLDFFYINSVLAMRSCPVGHMFRRVDVRRPGCVVSEFRCRMGGATGPSAPVMAVYVKIASIFVCLSVGVRVSGSRFHSGIHRYVSSFFSVDQIGGGGGWGGLGVCRPLIWQVWVTALWHSLVRQSPG